MRGTLSGGFLGIGVCLVGVRCGECYRDRTDFARSTNSATIDQHPQRLDRPMRARVADPPELLHRERSAACRTPRSVRRAPSRSAPACRDARWRRAPLGEAPVLPARGTGDPLEPRGPDRTGPRGTGSRWRPGCRGRDARALDVRMRAEQVEHRGHGVARRRRRGPPGCRGSSARGTMPSIAVRTSSGSCEAGASPQRAHASAASTPQPPAVVEHDHPPPARQRLRGERRRPLEGGFDVGARTAPSCSADAIEDAVVGGERAVRERGALAFARDAALHQHERLARGEPAHRRREAPPVRHAFEYATTDSCPGPPRSTRGTAAIPVCAEFPEETAFAMPTPVCTA